MEIAIKNSKLKDLHDALIILASMESPRQQQQSQEKPKPFRFKNAGQVRYNLARTFRRVDDALQAVEATRNGLVSQFLERQRGEFPQAVELQGRYLQEFQGEMRSVLERTELIDVRPVTVADLDLEANQDLPFTVVGILLDTIVTEAP